MSTINQSTSRRLPRPRLFQAVRGVTSGGLAREVLAGITLAALMIPLNIGYAQVAGLPPIIGLYAAIIPSIIWALTCNSRHVVASPDAAIGAMVIALVSPLAMPGDPRYIQLVFAQTILCGLIFFVFWIFRLGFLANFLSHAVLVGFITGLGIEVLFSQIRKIMGVSVEGEGFFEEAFATLLAIPEASLWSIAIGVGTIVIIRVLKQTAPKLPGALIGLILATILVSVLNLDERGVSVLGMVPAGLPAFALPDVALSDYVALFPGALALAAVTLAEAPLIARRYAEQYGEKLDVDQDLFAFGAANASAGLFGGFALGSSASRTAAMDSVGATTQIPSLVAGVVVAVILLFFTDLLALLPNAALAGIVANAVIKLIEVGEFRELRHVRRSEFWVAVVACVAVLVLGALQGVFIAFVLSLIDLIWRASQPHTAVLVAQPDGQSFGAPEGAPVQMTRPGLIIYRFGASLYFANANHFKEEIKTLVAEATPPVRWVVFDAEAISDIDTTGSRALAQVITSLQSQGITVAMSRAALQLPELLKRYELFEKIGAERIFTTNRDAVAAFERAEKR